MYDLILFRQCEIYRVVPDWVLEDWDIPKRSLLETADQAFKRQYNSLLWKVTEADIAKFEEANRAR